MLTKIGSKANGGDLQPLKFAEMLLCDNSLQTRRIAGCAFRGRVPWKRHEHLLFTEWRDWHVMLAAWVGVLRTTAWAPTRFFANPRLAQPIITWTQYRSCKSNLAYNAYRGKAWMACIRRDRRRPGAPHIRIASHSVALGHTLS